MIPFCLLISSCLKTAFTFVEEISTFMSSKGSKTIACFTSSSSSGHCAASKSLSFVTSPLHSGHCAGDFSLPDVSI